MARLEKPAPPLASLDRRALLTAAPAGLLAACQPRMRATASTTPKIDVEGLTASIAAIAGRTRPGALGLGLTNLESGEVFLFNGERPFPMHSVFKLLLGAAVLAEVDAGRVLLTERYYLTDEQLSPPHSPIATAWPARREYSAQELLEAAVIDADNTAADVMMKRIGGPGALTAWLTARRVPEVTVDRYARELACEANGMPSFRPAWRTEAAFAAAREAAPAARRLAAHRAFMADPRDAATARGMVEFLQMLDRGELVESASTRLLLQMLGRTTRGAGRIRAGLPKDAVLAHRPGTSGSDLGVSIAHNDVGIFTLADKRSYALAVFLSGSTLDEAAQDSIIADVTRAAVKAAG